MSLNIEPKNVFDFFYKINQIPRCSGNEKEISDFLVSFAKERNLEVVQDDAFNVIIKKGASQGYENSEIVILQGHMDMVCVKDDGVKHDFEKDAIDMYVDGDYLKSKGTTLGADDGIAVAYALAILDSDYKHPPLEVLITTGEETGMDGASAIKEGMLQGKKLLNLDSGQQGVFLTSCAGGSTVRVYFDIKKEDFDGKVITINISCLVGGHSGEEIIHQRANSNKLMTRILNEIRKVTQVRIIDIFGGSKHNAIPNNTTAKISVKDEKKAKIIIEKMTKILKEEYIVEEKNMNISYEDGKGGRTFDKNTTDRVIDFLMAVPDGVISMSKDIEGLVQTSINNAIITTDEDTIVLESSVRSSCESELDMVLDMVKSLANLSSATFKNKNRYPAWQYEKDSYLRDMCIKTYEELFGKKPIMQAIHAGLECGLLKKAMPNCDMISYGPDMHDIHTPKERLSISSTKNMWDFTIKLLENLK